MDKIDAFVNVANNEMVSRTKSALKSIKIMGIIFSVILILSGITLFVTPIKGTAIAMWMMVFGLFLRSLSDVILYFKLPKPLRNAFDLIIAVLWVVITIVALSGAAYAPTVDKIIAIELFYKILAFMVAFNCFASGITALCIKKNVRSLGMNISGISLYGILSIVTGIGVIIYPVSSAIVLTSMFGIYLLIGGLSLFCRFISISIK